MNVGSLFSGIGGIDLGLERAGHTVVFQCEADEWRRTVLAEQFAGTPCYDDVCEVAQGSRWGRPGLVGGDGARSHVELDGSPVSVESASVDLLCGGFPCQDLSVAGRRAGLAGARSGLFFEFARIAESLRPEWLLIENVPGLLSSNGGRDFGELLGTLADIGYGVGWRLLDSRFFGVPQRRRRVFILAHNSGGRAGADRCGHVLSVGSRCHGHSEANGRKGSRYAATLTRGSATGRGVNPPGRRQEDDVNLVAQPLMSHHGRNAIDSDNFVVGPLQTGHTPNGHGMAGVNDQAAASGHIVPTLEAGVRRLTPRECERLQGFPDDWTAFGPDSRRYSALGDAVTVPVAQWLGERIAA